MLSRKERVREAHSAILEVEVVNAEVELFIGLRLPKVLQNSKAVVNYDKHDTLIMYLHAN
jgi:hypothetical protein